MDNNEELLNEETQEEVTNDEPTPTSNTLVDDVKLALRISHNLLDDEIADVIASARQEMVRAGVDSAIANGEAEDAPTELVEKAIKTYAMEYYTRDVKEADRYSESFKYQCDNLRKSYPAEVVVDV